MGFDLCSFVVVITFGLIAVLLLYFILFNDNEEDISWQSQFLLQEYS